MIRATIVMFLIGALATVAVAEIVPIAQTRSVSCSAYAEDSSSNDSDNDADSALDFGPFTGAVSAQIELDGALGSGSAHQTSSIEPYAIGVHGGCAANGEGWEFDGNGSGTGSTIFLCEFTITATTRFTLTGYIDAYDSGDAGLSLTGPSVSLSRFAQDTEVTLDESGELEPGTYVLGVEANSSAYGDDSFYGYAYAGFSVEFVLAAPTSAPGFGDEMSLTVGPNPFAGHTQIAYSTPLQATATLEVFDVRGRRLRRFAAAGGSRSVLTWDGRDDDGRNLAPGLYFLVLRSGDEVRREKVMRLR